MPDQSHPPYVAGAKTIPRTLIRWLDVNPQNGQLRRTQTYVTLPAFSQGYSTWNGYSDIVASFNCESPNGFSIVGIASDIPPTPNYALCISYRVGTKVTRYILWDATGSLLNQSIPYYTNQPIKKNFRFEVWNTSQGAASQSTPITFYTSVAGGQDYRYAVDSALVVADSETTAFTVANNYAPIALPLQSILSVSYNVNKIVPNYWYSNQSNSYAFITSQATPTIVNDTGIYNSPTVEIPASFTYEGGLISNTTTAYMWFSLVKFSGLFNGAIPLGFGSGWGSADMNVTYNSIEQRFYFNSHAIGAYGSAVDGVWYIFAIYYNVQSGTAGAYIVPLSAPTAPTLTQASYGAQPTMTQLKVGDATTVNTVPMSVAEMLVYQPTVGTPLTQGNQQLILNYLAAKYTTPTWSIPITFPTNAVSVTN